MEPPYEDDQPDDVGTPGWRDDDALAEDYDDRDPRDEAPRRALIVGVVLALVLVAGAIVAVAVNSGSDDDGDDDSELSVDESTTTSVRRTTSTTSASSSTSIDPSEGTGTTVGVGGSTTTTVKSSATTSTTAASSGNTTAPGTDSKLDALWNACRDGNMQSCDRLYSQSTKGTAYSAFGDTCGNRRAAGGGYCLTKADRPTEYGDDPELDGLHDRCTAGEFAACDQLYLDSYSGSQYEQHALTCGGRNAPTGSCVATHT